MEENVHSTNTTKTMNYSAKDGTNVLSVEAS